MNQATLKRPFVRSVPIGIATIVGTRRGALKVIGFHRFAPRWFDGKPHTRWVVQCDCGAYDIRSGRSLKRQNMDDECGFCASERQEFRKAFYAREGRYPDYYELPHRPSRQPAKLPVESGTFATPLNAHA